MAMENTLLTPAKQKQLVIKEVVKKHLKEAGFKSVGQTYYSVRNDICLAVHIFSSQNNSFFTGYEFCLRIKAFPTDIEKEELRMINGDFTENGFLPNYGLLHPYHNILGYTIGGYRDYKPKVQNYEDIRDYIDNDFRQYIMPRLLKIQCGDDYNECKDEIQRYVSSREISIIRFLSSIHNSGNIRPKYDVADFFERWHITVEDVRESRAIYEQVREWSDLPNHDNWDYLMEVLDTYF